jgi:hypothetical protein
MNKGPGDSRRNELRLILSPDMVQQLLDDQPEAKVEITKRIIDTTANRMIRQAMNNRDLLTETRDCVTRKLDSAVRKIGTQLTGTGWSKTEVLSKAVRTALQPLIEKEAKKLLTAALKLLGKEKQVKLLADTVISDSLAKGFTYETTRKLIAPHLEKLVSAELQKRLG